MPGARSRGGALLLGDAGAALDPRRTVMMLTLPGDRRDADLRATMAATRFYVDEYVIYDTTDRRGRAEGEIMHLLATFLPPD